jgi:hypothetical protein
MPCENPHIWLEAVNTLTQPLYCWLIWDPENYYLEVMDEVFSNQPDLTDQHIGHPDIDYFTDGSCLIWDGMHFAGYAVVTLDLVIEAHQLLVVTSAQKAELVALTWTLQLMAGVLGNIFADSKYAFTTIHVYGVLYKERGLINLGGKSIKYGQDILKLLDAIWAPKWVVVIHC